MNQDIEYSLQLVGLTPNEITLYTHLLRKGPSASPEIYVENNLDKSAAYEALSNLNKKGLVYTIGKTRNQRFAAVSSEKLYELLSDKQTQLQEAKINLDIFVKEIDEFAKQTYKNKNIRVFEGDKGFEIWSKARLETPNTTLRTLASYNLHSSYIKNYDDEYSEEQVKTRLSKNIFQKVLTKKSDIVERQTSTNVSNFKLKKEVRLLPETFDIPASLATFDNKTSFLTKKDGQFLGIIIEDRLITSLINSLFDSLWETAPKI